MVKNTVFSQLFKYAKTTVDSSAESSSVTPMTILTGILIVFIYYKAYEYLDGLRSCSCAPKDLTTLKNLEMFFVVVTALYAILHTIKYFSNNTQVIPRGSEFVINAIYFAFLLAIELVYIYNVYTHIYGTNNCECMNHWEKYILYYQSILYSFLPLLIILILLIVGFGPALAFIIIVSSFLYYAFDNMSQRRNQIKQSFYL